MTVNLSGSAPCRLQSLLLEDLEVRDFPSSIYGLDGEVGLVLVGARMNMSPVPDRARDLPFAPGHKALLARHRYHEDALRELAELGV